MNTNIINGVGLLGHAIGYCLVEKDYNQAFTDFMKALGEFGVHESIKTAMETVPQAKFQSRPNGNENDKH